jgi:phosphoglucomutase
MGLLYSSAPAWKRRAVSAYTLFAREVVTGSADPESQEAFLEAMSKGSEASPVAVVAEFNGSARCLSIDEDFLSGVGAGFLAINGKPRAFAHRIVPEGDSLADCCRALEAAHATEPAYVAGYVPDCDGDRGNLVIFDEGAGRARLLAAQEVFALCCVAETAQLVREGKLRYGVDGSPLDKVAIAVNDGTSMRVEAIAAAFGATVFRSETGEPNVVGLAEKLRAEGYTVRILGEGSNGGNITYPSAVRDPLATVSVILKLLTLRGSDPMGSDPRRTTGTDPVPTAPGLYRIWLEKSGQLSRYRPDFGLADILASLPAYATTSAFEPVAALKIRSMDHAGLKARYHGLFVPAWEKDRTQFRARFGAVSWEAFASNGPGQSSVGDDFAASGKGGLRIVFSNAEGAAVAFAWMRGSGTEPVFRVMADVSTGRPEDEAWLLDWHRNLVLAADQA